MEPCNSVQANDYLKIRIVTLNHIIGYKILVDKRN